jgi:Ca2+-transporting ATPase
MFPDAKLKVVEALKKNGEVVAMTGDGVNDGPALKAAHISIAMGQSGSELAKSTASLILTDDDLSHMTDAVAMGRKIYDNLKKAIRYIISIHIPIIGIVALPLLLFWPMTAFFSPIHVIFLELIMGPTCSIVFENEPMESGTMKRKPLPKSSSFLSLNQLTLSIIQGVFITAGCLGLGFYMMKQGRDITFVRTCIFMTLLLSNVFLTLVNRSFTLSLWESFKNKNKLVPIAILFSIVFMILSLQIPFIRALFGLSSLNRWDWIICASVALICTCWLEGYKFYIRRNSKG